MLRAAAHTILVTPTGDNSEREIGNLFVAGAPTQERIYQGVIEHVGSHVCEEGVGPGDVAYYLRFIELENKHVVAEQHIIAFDTES